MRLLLITIIIFLNIFNTNAESSGNIKTANKLITEKSIINNIEIQNENKKNIKLGEELVIDLSNTEKELEEKYNSSINFEWSLQGATIKKGSIYKNKFEKYGNKELSLNIYSLGDDGEKLIENKNFKLFIYKEKNYLIIDNKNIEKSKLNLYIEKASNEGIYVEKLINSNEKRLKQENVLNAISSKIKTNQNKGDYITLWGDKNFIFSVISKINIEVKNTDFKGKINLVLLSSFNTDVLNNYLRNLISNKKWINKILLLSEISKSQIWLNPSNITELENSLKKKEYEYKNINKNSKISEFLFISKFVNSLSNNGLSNIYIYLIIIIPFLFTGISVFKHLVGLSPIGIIIPISLTLLIFQIGLVATFIIFFSLILINLLLGKVTNKYTLLYTPKISFIIIINLVIIILLLNFLFMYNLINIDISDTLFIILFIIVSERFITIVLSKEFSEYKYNLLNTIAFAMISYILLSVPNIQTLILAYPEVILILIPINFIIGKFTGLRITEYFRFKEVIKSIEE